MDWFLYDNGLRHKELKKIPELTRKTIAQSVSKISERCLNKQSREIFSATVI